MGRSAFHRTCKKCGAYGHNEKTCTTKMSPALSRIRQLYDECTSDTKRPPYILTKDGVINTNKEAHR